jgi:hypothetical protein
LPNKQSQDPEKRIKCTDLVANTLNLQNTVDLTEAARDWVARGYEVTREDRELLRR